MRRGNAAIAWGRSQISDPVKDFTALCLQFVRMCFGIELLHPSAIVAWDKAERRHPTTDSNTIPRGVPVFWRVGKHGHVALSLGGGLCLSTDVKRRGRVDVVRIDAIAPAWGATLLGWTEDLNGKRVHRPKPIAPEAPPAPAATNVSRAKAQLRVARRSIAIADKFLAAVPDERTVAKAIADQLDQLEDRLDAAIRKLPER